MKVAVAAALAVVVVAVLVVLGFTLKHTVTGTETFQGTTTGLAAITANNPKIPLIASGLVSSPSTSCTVTRKCSILHSGSIYLGGGANGTIGYLRFENGVLAVRHYTGLKADQSQSFSKVDCSFTQVDRGEFRTVPGLSTGAFKGMSGRGTYTVTFAGKFKLTDGKCVVTSSTAPVSGKITFKATGQLSHTKHWLGSGGSGGGSSY